MKQRACLDNLILACAGLAPESHLLLEWKAHYIPQPSAIARSIEIEEKPTKKKISENISQQSMDASTKA